MLVQPLTPPPIPPPPYCQDHLTALMEVNEENQQLATQYDREKQRRREIEEVQRSEILSKIVHQFCDHLQCFALTLQNPSRKQKPLAFDRSISVSEI